MRRLVGAYRSAFAGLPRDVWLLAAATLVNRSGTMVLPFMSLYLTRRLSFSTVEAGRVLSLYGLGAIVGSYLGGWLSDRFGALRVQEASLLATGAGFLVLSRLHGKIAFAVAMLLLSAVAEWFRPALLTAVAQLSPPSVRTRSMALIRLAVNSGLSIGPALGGVLAVRHYGWLFLVDALTCWAAVALLRLTLHRRAAPPVEASGSPAAAPQSPWRDVPFVAFLLLVTGLTTVFFQISSTLPLYLRSVRGFNEATIGGLLAINAVTIVCVEMVLLRFVERFHHLRVAALGSLLVCTGLALMPLSRGVVFAASTVLVWTAGEMLSLPMTNATAGLRSGVASSGRYIGAYTLSFSCAFVLAPLVGTTVYQRFGPNVLWAAIGVAGLPLWAGFFALARRLTPLPDPPARDAAPLRALEAPVPDE